MLFGPWLGLSNHAFCFYCNSNSTQHDEGYSSKKESKISIICIGVWISWWKVEIGGAAAGWKCYWCICVNGATVSWVVKRRFLFLFLLFSSLVDHNIFYATAADSRPSRRIIVRGFLIHKTLTAHRISYPSPLLMYILRIKVYLHSIVSEVSKLCF